jgi:hypothetical protein
MGPEIHSVELETPPSQLRRRNARFIEVELRVPGKVQRA